MATDSIVGAGLAQSPHAELRAEVERLRRELAEAREALRDCLSWHDFADDMHKPIEVRAAYMRARSILAAAPAEPKGDAIKAFVDGQQPLGELFEKVLHDNLSSLIRQSNGPKGDGGHTA